MKTFNDFKLEQEKHEIASLIFELKIDPDAYFEQILEEGIFKKMGDWWKKNVSAPNVVRLQSSYDQARQAVDNFVKNMISLRKQGYSTQSMAGTGLYPALRQIKTNLASMKDQVAQMDQHAQQNVTKTPYADIGNWDRADHPSMGQMAHKGGQMAKQGAAYMGQKGGEGAAYMGQKFGDWKEKRRQRKMGPWERGMERMGQNQP